MKITFVHYLSVVILALCPANLAWPQTAAAAKVLGPGWQCLLVPTSFDGPGTIFSIESDGTKSRIVDLSKASKSGKPVPVKTQAAGIGVITSDRKVNAGIAVSLLEKISPGLAAKISAGGHHLDVSKVQYGDVQEETTFDTDLKPILNAWLAKNAKEYMSGAAGTRYFVVRDAYRAGMVDYHFSKDNVAELGGEGTFKSLFSANLSLSGGYEAGYDLNQKFDPRLRVCVRTYEIAQTRGLSGADCVSDCPRRWHCTRHQE